MKRTISPGTAVGIGLLWLLISPAWAVPDIHLDDFAAPSVAQSTLGVQNAYTVSTTGTFAGEAGQVRDATYYLDANGGSAAALIGGGSASVQSAYGTGGTYDIAYGSWAVNPYTPEVQGPAMNLDLSGYHHFLVGFSRIDAPVNIDVVFYTSQPLNEQGAVYYTSAGVNFVPSAPGTPVFADLAFNTPTDSSFNFQHVDGVFVEVQAGGANLESSYAVDHLTISPVPEPGSLVLMLAGMAGLVWYRRRAGLRQLPARGLLLPMNERPASATWFPLLLVSVPIACFLGAGLAHADPVAETVQHSFTGADGAYPSFGTPTLGTDGNFYGVTEQGGDHQLGAVYKLAPDGTETLLYSFQGSGDGVHPSWTLARDAKGNFYGMTDPDSTNHGTVFRITSAGVFTTLHAFATSGSEGWAYENAVTLGQDGQLYGVTLEGGTYGDGTLFRMKTDGSEFTVLFNFGGGAVTDQALVYPQAGVVQGADGNFYGLSTGFVQQHFYTPDGAVYRITPTGAMTSLYIFTDSSMEPPIGIPRFDAAGNLYFYGDIRESTMSGRIYKLDPSNTLSTLHQFTTQEGVPSYSGQLLLGRDGRLYGTTYWGGPNGAWDAGPGTVFSLGLDGQFAVLHDFGSIADDGSNPQSGLVAAADGSLWGTTRVGGSTGAGTAYRLTKPTEKLAIKPSSITVGQAAILRWSSANATSCEATGSWGPQAEDLSGSSKVMPAAPGTYTYSLACSGAGTVSRSVTLTVK